MNNPQWLELPMSGTNFHDPKDIGAIEVSEKTFKPCPAEPGCTLPLQTV